MEVKEIIVHCTATPQGRSVSVKDIDRWHRERGFQCIGYHWVVYLDGSVHAGRAENKIGAHCLKHNAFSIGVCYVGGLDADGKTPKDTRTENQKLALRKLLIKLRRKYPGAKIHSHRDFAAKACPCFDATAEYSDI